MKHLAVLFSSVVCFNVYSQSGTPDLIATAGDVFKNNEVELSWSVGEIMIETFSVTGNLLTQGFHQPDYEIATITDEKTGNDYTVLVFPNPASDIVTIQVIGITDQKLTYRLIDLHGRILLVKSLNNTTEQINISRLSPGLFLLQVITESGEKVCSYKIQKKS